jgi:serine protease SohB
MWLNVAEFAIKTFLVVFAIAILAILIASLIAKAKGTRESVQIENLNKKMNDWELALRRRVLSAKAFKVFAKKSKLSKKDEHEEGKKRIYVLQFDGDIKASGVDRLRDEVTAVLTVARPNDEVVVRVESPGGMVHSYGLAAAQLTRIRDKNIPLTICVDKVAASGGYMMAVTGNKILAAPFAILGSIGVVAQVPNVHKLLKKHDVDYEEFTAGEYKRTVSVFGEITPKGRQHFKDKMEVTHVLFKNWVKHYRPHLNVDEVANGDYMYGTEALTLGLVDELISSDDYLFRLRNSAEIFKIEIAAKKKLADRLAENFSLLAERAFDRLLTRLKQQEF